MQTTTQPACETCESPHVVLAEGDEDSGYRATILRCLRCGGAQEQQSASTLTNPNRDLRDSPYTMIFFALALVFSSGVLALLVRLAFNRWGLS